MRERFGQFRTLELRNSARFVQLLVRYIPLLTSGQFHGYASRTNSKRGIRDEASSLDEEDNNNA